MAWKTITAHAARRLRIAAAVATGLALTGCGSIPLFGPQDTTGGDAQTDAAARFVACLRASDVEARIGSGLEGESGDGLVFVRQQAVVGSDGSIEFGSASAGESPLLVSGDESGMWVAPASSAYFVDDPDTQDAYAACEQAHPEFEQPEFDVFDDPAFQEQLAAQQEAALAFARCARDAGFAWVADPATADQGAIALPADLTESEFRALLTACSEQLGQFAWAVDGELGFDWLTVLQEVQGEGGSSSIRVEGGDGASAGTGARR